MNLWADRDDQGNPAITADIRVAKAIKAQRAENIAALEPESPLGKKYRKGGRKFIGTDRQFGNREYADYCWVDIETGQAYAWPMSDGDGDTEIPVEGWGD